MNRSKLYDHRHYVKVLRAGGIAKKWQETSTCYLVALVREDGTLHGVHTLSDSAPTAAVSVVPVVIDQWEAKGFYGNAHRRALRDMRHGAHRWAWPWVNPGLAAHEARLDLFVTANRGEIRPPADVAEKAADLWRRRNKVRAEFRRYAMEELAE